MSANEKRSYCNTFLPVQEETAPSTTWALPYEDKTHRHTHTHTLTLLLNICCREYYRTETPTELAILKSSTPNSYSGVHGFDSKPKDSVT